MQKHTRFALAFFFLTDFCISSYFPCSAGFNQMKSVSRYTLRLPYFQTPEKSIAPDAI